MKKKGKAKRTRGRLVREEIFRNTFLIELLYYFVYYLTWIKFRVDLISRTTKIFNFAWI